jgi:hypothetical protein
MTPADGISDWLDAPDTVPAPTSPKQVGDWLDAPDAAGGKPDVGAWLDAPDVAAAAPAVPETGFIDRTKSLFGSGVNSAVSGLAAVGAKQAGERQSTLLPVFDAIDQGHPVPIEVGASMLYGQLAQRYKSADPDERAKIRAEVESAPGEQVNIAVQRGIQASSVPQSEATKAFGKALETGDYGNALGLLVSNPVQIIGQEGVRSLPVMMPSLAVGLVNPIVGVEAMAGSDAAVEYGNSLIDYLGQNGVDTTNPAAVKAAMADKQIMASASKYANARAGVTGVADLITGGLAGRMLVPGRMITNQLGREAANELVAQPIVQAIGGGATEAGAQLASTGKINDPASVGLSAAGEMVTAPAEALSFGSERIFKKKPGAGENPPPPPGAAGGATPETTPPAAGLDTSGLMPDMKPGTVVGLANPDGSVDRVNIAGVDKGIVFYQHPDGTTYGTPVEDFTPAVRPAPPAADVVRGDATTVPEGEPPAAQPITTESLNDFNPDEAMEKPKPVIPSPPPAQAKMALPDTEEITNTEKAAREYRKAAVQAQSIADAKSPQAKSAEEIARMHRQADALDAEAVRLRQSLAAKSTVVGGTEAATEEARQRRAAGPLGAITEGTATGEPELTAPRQPLAAMEAANRGPTGEPVLPEARRGLTAMEAATKAPGEPVLPEPRQPLAAMEAAVKGPTEASTGTSLTTPGSPAKKGEAVAEPAAAPAPLLTSKPKMAAKPVVAPVTVATPDILDAVAAAGGIQDEHAMRYKGTARGNALKIGGDLEPLYSTTNGRRKSKTRFIKGLGPRSLVNNRTGMNPDRMREHLVQLGYLPEGSEIRDLYDHLQRAAAGERIVPTQLQTAAEAEAAADEQRARTFGTEATPEQQRALDEQSARRDLEDLGETAPAGATLEDLEAQRGERLAMMGAASVDEAIRKMQTEQDAMDALLTDQELEEVRRGTYEGDFADHAVEGQPETGGVPESGAVGEAAAGVAGKDEAAGGAPAEAEPGVGEEGPVGQANVGPLGIPGGFDNLTDDLRSNVEKGSSPIDWVREYGKETGNEYIAVTRANGAVLLGGTSNMPGSVMFPQAMAPELMDGASALTLQHNHPLTAALSGTDISVLPYPGVNFIIAASHSGEISAAALTQDVIEATSDPIAGEDLDNLNNALQIAYLAADDTLMSVEPNPLARQELSMRALNEAGIIEYHTTHKIPVGSRNAISLAANNIRKALSDEEVDLGPRPEATAAGLYRPAVYVSPSSAMAAVSRRAKELAPRQSGGPTPNETGFRNTGDEEKRGVGNSDVSNRRAIFSGRSEAIRSISEANGADTTGRPGRSKRNPPSEVRSGGVGENPEPTQEERGVDEGKGTPATEISTTPAGGTVENDAGRQADAAAPRSEDTSERLANSPGAAKTVSASVNRAANEGPIALRALGKIGDLLSFAATVASKDRISAKYYVAEKAMARYAETLVRDAADQVSKYLTLPTDAKGRVHAVLEHDRLAHLDRKPTGRRVAVRIPDNYAGELAKSGDVITLNAEESQALADLRKFFDDRWDKFGAAMAKQFGWDGPFTKEGIQAAIDAADSAKEKARGERAMEIYNMTDGMRRSGYTPFARYGDTKITIRPKPKYVPGKDGLQHFQPARVELVNGKTPLESVFGADAKTSSKPIADRLKELQKQFPPSKFDYEVRPLNSIEDLKKVDLPAVEKLFMVLNSNNKEFGTKFFDEIVKQIYDERKAGFRKQSHNVAGYSTDFERAIADYIHSTSSTISRMEHGKEVNEAFEGTQKHQDPDVSKFWKDYRDHIEVPGDWTAGLRRIGFWSFIWGSASSAISNLAQSPLVTMPQTSAWAGTKAVSSVGGAITHAMQAISVNRDGLTIDWSKVGRTPAERAMVAKLRAEGVLDPVISKDLQGAGKGTNPTERKWQRRFDRAYDIGASAFNAAEMANRIGAALSAFRLAQDPKIMAAAQKVYGRDAEFQEMVGRNGTPTDLARFMVDETQFIGGKRGQPRVMRGAGSLLLQWKQYQANWMRLLYKNMSRMGPEGKMAGTAMLVGLMATSGLLGLPFAEDLKDLYSWAYKKATGIDPLLERRVASWLNDIGFGDVGAEAILHGGSRSTLGIELGSRLGMGNMAPDAGIENAFPLLGATVGKASEVAERLKSGQPLGAATALLPKGAQDLAKSVAVYPNEGLRTQKGDLTLAPSEITAGEQFARAVGFQPTRFARIGDYKYSQRELKSATQEASTRLITRLASELALAADAKTSGDTAAVGRHTREYLNLLRDNADQLQDPDLPGWQKIPQPSARAIRARLQSMVNFEPALMKQTSKLKRSEMGDYPLPKE